MERFSAVAVLLFNVEIRIVNLEEGDPRSRLLGPLISRGTKGVPRKGFEHRSTRGSEHAKNREQNTLKPAVAYDPPFLGTPISSL